MAPEFLQTQTCFFSFFDILFKPVVSGTITDAQSHSILGFSVQFWTLDPDCFTGIFPSTLMREVIICFAIYFPVVSFESDSFSA